MFYPGSKHSGKLYNVDGTEYTSDLYDSGGHLRIRYVGGNTIQDTHSEKEIIYVPGTPGSLTYSNKKAQVKNKP